MRCRCSRWISLVVALAVVGTISTSASAMGIQWLEFDSWVPDATSGSVAYKSGFVSISISPTTAMGTGAASNAGFDSVSATYPNIDTAAYDHFFVRPDPSQTGSPWSIELDFVGASLTPADAFNIGQLFVSSATGVATGLVVQIFAVDDVTPISASELLFEQHSRSPGFTVPLLWDPTTGTLTAASPVVASENSSYGFFRHGTSDIGRIVVTATTLASPNGDTIDFGLAVPEPGSALLLVFGFVASRRIRR